MSSLDSLKEELLKSDEDFRHLYEEHQECERRLTEIHEAAVFSQENEIEEKRIKLHKLALKDRMYELLRAADVSRVSA